MVKYLSIIKAYMRGSLMNQMEYKFNFLVGGTFELIWMTMYIVFINVIFLHSDSINGWNKYEMLMLTFQGGLMDSAFTMFIVPGLRRLPEMVNNGSLDFILLKPINKRFNISLNEFDIPQIKNILINIIGIIYCINKLKLSLSPGIIFIYLFLSINGFLLIYSIMFILMSCSFWVMRMDVLMRVGSELITVGNKPMTIYPQIIQKILIYIVPLLVCFNFPVLFVVKGLKLQYIIYSFLSTIIIFILSNYIFGKGLRKYVSASS